MYFYCVSWAKVFHLNATECGLADPGGQGPRFTPLRLYYWAQQHAGLTGVLANTERHGLTEFLERVRKSLSELKPVRSQQALCLDQGEGQVCPCYNLTFNLEASAW